MRRLALVFALLSITSAAYGQLGLPSLISSAVSNSVIDQNGNLIVFDVSYSYPSAANQSTALRFPPIVKTHVTVIPIAAGGATKTSFDYDGALQVAGVGRNGVYATVSTYTATTIPLGAPSAGSGATGAGGTVSVGGGTIVIPTPSYPIAFTTNRRLVALNAVASTFPTSLPVVDALGGADVKISEGVGNNAPDTIAVIDSTSLSSHSVRLFTFNGTSFKAINDTPIKVP